MISQRYEILFKEHFHGAVYVAQVVVGSRQTAEDIVQEVFIRMLDIDLEKIASPSRYLYASVRYAAIDHKRANSPRRDHSFVLPEIPDNSDADLSSSEIEHANRVRKLFKAIEQLPERSRQIVKLICLNNYSYRRAAEELGIGEATVKTHMYRSMRFLRKIIAISLVFS